MRIESWSSVDRHLYIIMDTPREWGSVAVCAQYVYCHILSVGWCVSVATLFHDVCALCQSNYGLDKRYWTEHGSTGHECFIRHISWYILV